MLQLARDSQGLGAMSPQAPTGLPTGTLIPALGPLADFYHTPWPVVAYYE
jgi:hypothetical protein